MSLGQDVYGVRDRLDRVCHLLCVAIQAFEAIDAVHEILEQILTILHARILRS